VSGKAGKYALVERERRFLLAGPPDGSVVTASRVITDRYLTGTRLRLRRVELAGGGCQWKLTQKIPAPGAGAVQGLITNTYLSQDEFDVLSALPAAVLTKTRYSLSEVGVDVFEGRLAGLVLAEAEFDSDEEAASFVPPVGCVAEVTDDGRFTGGSLVRAARADLLGWLAEYGIRPEG
jgi:CYTH domain-containing protein